MKLKKAQQGHASILFAIMIPVLFGIFTLASDGARAIQTKARIEDATEAASLAIAAHNDPNVNSDGLGSGSKVNRRIATDYLKAYITDIDSISSLKIYRRNCEDIPECSAGLNKGKSRFFEYEVEALTTQNSWFPGNNVISGFGDTFSTRGHSLARKYQSEAVDVVFAADFSGSMLNSWTGGRQKYRDLVRVINDVTNELEKFNNINVADKKNQNMIGISPYNSNTFSKFNNYNSCFMKQDYFEKDSRDHRKKKYVDIKRTINNIFVEKGNDSCGFKSSRPSAVFHDIDLTRDFDKFNKEIKAFEPGNGTGSYQGIIRSAQMLRKGTNSRRLLIIISDGEDWDEGTYSGYKETDKEIANKLVNAGMCNKIRETLNLDKTPSGQEIKTRIAVIGFDYDANKNKALLNCAGEENVFKAQYRDELLDQILSLITEEIGHLK
ncbi:TadE/TadG family type IV pilus assembly protein [Photobacterium damselae]|uniref:TadE/TadG family type IV pilus assembly protein n=1 Tax=Photobacterium damselae TaxID=38293 RepID=UPI0030F37771